MFKKLSWFLLLFLSLGIFNTVSADDTSSNPIFTAQKDKVTCISVADPLDVPNGYFLLFDYSSAIGTQLGRPWSVIEKGKCYEIDNSGGIIYLVKGGPEEQARFKNANLYKPDQNVEYKSSKMNSDGTIQTVYSFDNVISQILPSDEADYRSGPLEAYLQTFYLPNIIPTKYHFGEGITYTSSIEGMYEESGKNFDYSGYPPEEIRDIKITTSIFNDPRYNNQILNLYSNFAKGLTDTLNSCDNRGRVEYQLNLQNQSLIQIWKLKDGTVIAPTSDEYDGFDNQIGFITQIGCRDAYKAYIQNERPILEQIDAIALAILKDNNVSSDNNTISFNPELTKINGYISGAFVPVKLSKTEIEESERVTWLPDILKVASSKEQAQFSPSTEPTVLEEPTPEKKMEEVQHSNNNVFRLYTILPLIGFAAIVLLIILKKRK